jgi:hypothetical protein
VTKVSRELQSHDRQERTAPHVGTRNGLPGGPCCCDEMTGMMAAAIAIRVIRHLILLGGPMDESRDVGCVQATVDGSY